MSFTAFYYVYSEKTRVRGRACRLPRSGQNFKYGQKLPKLAFLGFELLEPLWEDKPFDINNVAPVLLQLRLSFFCRRLLIDHHPLALLYALFGLILPMHSLLFGTLLPAALGLIVSVIAAPTTTTTQSSNSQNGFASAWYEGWESGLSPSDISWDKLSSVTFAFASPSNNVSFIDVEPSAVLTSLVEEAHCNVSIVKFSQEIGSL